MARRRSYDYEFPRYFSQPSVELLRQNAERSTAAAGKKGKQYNPVIPKGNSRTICVSWWGQAWCRNMESYADYDSRLGRGKRYVTSGTVLDLQIGEGTVEAKVQGSRRTPYQVRIGIDPLNEKKKKEITGACSRELKSMEDLICGRFPAGLETLLLQRGSLFPDPKEIHMSCSCPDWAVMCKHVAAVMYGIGVRLDDNPFYFFTLRGLDVDSFVTQALQDRVESMLANADAASDRILPEEDISALFGVL